MSKKIDLSGRTAYITGGSRGIGLACVEELAGAGARVAFSSRAEQQQLDELASSLSARYDQQIIGIQADVSDPNDVKRSFKLVQKSFGQLDVFVNNAGVMHTALLAFTNVETIRSTMDVNVTGALLNMQMASKLMARKTSGSIVNIASIVGRHGAEGQIAYSTSKAAVIGMTRAAAKEFGAQQIRVNAVAPGFIDTELLADFNSESRQRVLAGIKLGRIGAAEDVALSVLFLASDLASYVTGEVLGVDGGMVI